MTLRVLFHVNHLWGVGHFTRVAAIANAVAEAGGEATVLAGNSPLAAKLSPGVTLVRLPVIRSPDPTYARLVDVDGQAVAADLWDERLRMIDQVMEERWDALVTETFPFGRRKLSAELLHLVAAAKAQHAKIVSSIRDLPTAPADHRRLSECAHRLSAHFDAVLVHGDPSVIPLQDVWPGAIPVPAHMTGYVTTPPVRPAAPRDGVLVSAGGGGDAPPLLLAAAAARRTANIPPMRWTFVTGHLASGDLVDDLRAMVLPDDEILPSVEDLPERLATARLAVSRGGYNTVIEAVAAGTPNVVVPFAPDGEDEQAIRAVHFAAAGLVQHLPEGALSAATLAAACARALTLPAPDPGKLNLDGAAHSAALLARIVSGH